MTQPFIIYALPRSRTAWLSEFLTYGEYNCGHENAIYMRSIADIKALFKPNSGTVETAAAQAWRIIHHHIPGLRAAVIRRPVDEVIDSVLKVPLNGVATYDEIRLQKIMAYGDRVLKQISALPGVLTLNYSDISNEDACAALFEHCLPYEFDQPWWEWMKGRNVQANVPGIIRYYHENKSAIEGFKLTLKRELRTLYKNGQIDREGRHGVSIAHH